MASLVASVCIEAPASQVWEHLARLEDIDLWSDVVVSARCEGSQSRGVGAERTCELMGNRTITERWVAWDEGRSFQYEGVGLPAVKRAVNRWSLSPQGDRTLVTSAADVVFKGGPAGRVLGLILAPLMRRMATGALAGFKYLVEHGQPYDGEGAKLPRAPVSCP